MCTSIQFVVKSDGNNCQLSLNYIDNAGAVSLLNAEVYRAVNTWIEDQPGDVQSKIKTYCQDKIVKLQGNPNNVNARFVITHIEDMLKEQTVAAPQQPPSFYSAWTMEIVGDEPNVNSTFKIERVASKQLTQKQKSEELNNVLIIQPKQESKPRPDEETTPLQQPLLGQSFESMNVKKRGCEVCILV